MEPPKVRPPSTARPLGVAGVGVADVVDYFSWRQADAARCALNGWCYWTLRKAGQSRQQATAALERASTADKNELLFGHGIRAERELPMKDAYRHFVERLTADTPGSARPSRARPS